MSKTIRIATILTLAAQPIWAQMGAMAQVAAEHAPPEQSSGGMPQLDFGNPWTIAQVVWMLIIFGALYFVMKQYALPQVEGVLAARRARIEADLESARRRSSGPMRRWPSTAERRRARAESQAAINAAAQRAQEEAAARSEALNARLRRPDRRGRAADLRRPRHRHGRPAPGGDRDGGCAWSPG